MLNTNIFLVIWLFIVSKNTETATTGIEKIKNK